MSEPRFVYFCNGKDEPVKLDLGEASGWKLVWTESGRWYTLKNRLFYGDFDDAEWAALKQRYPDAVFSDQEVDDGR